MSSPWYHPAVLRRQHLGPFLIERNGPINIRIFPEGIPLGMPAGGRGPGRSRRERIAGIRRAGTVSRTRGSEPARGLTHELRGAGDRIGCCPIPSPLRSTLIGHMCLRLHQSESPGETQRGGARSLHCSVCAHTCA